MTSLKRRICLLIAVVAAPHPACAAQHASPAESARSDKALINSARDLLSAHQPEKAETILQFLLSHDPEDADALVLLAGIRVDQQNDAEASTLLARALAASPNSVAANDLLGNLQLRAHRFPEAMDRFETVLKIAPRDSGARHGEFAAATELALSARKADHPEVALQVLQHAKIALPDDLKLLIDIGVEATELHAFNDAENALEAARTLSPSDPDMLYASAQLEIEQQHMAKAESDFREYLKSVPTDASAHFGLGHVYVMEQRVQEARTEFHRSIELQPVQTECYYQLGQLDLDAQHDADAEPLFRKVLARDPAHGGALAGMGVIAFRAKDYAAAEQYLGKAEKASPDYVPAHYYRGLALARMGRKDAADVELHLAAQLGQAASNATMQGTVPQNAPPQ